ncbi:hypothetical protein B0H19DRAFT_1260982 [Mycena capillaripes]|nr:hypothetical protein B0H19DRAFT_1260982 [Mycena capillaripes]
MAVLPGTKESYAGALLENIIYGFYLSAFLECCMLFYKQKQRGAIHAYLLATTSLMFIFITTRCVIDTYRCVVAFDSGYFHVVKGNADVDFGLRTPKLAVFGSVCWLLVTLVADVFIVFRTFIVWNRRWLVIIIPSLLCLANTITSVLAIISLSDLDGASMWSVVDWLNAVVSLTLSTNIICTGLISFRIIRVYRQVAGMVSRKLGRSDSIKILSVIVESAAIYTTVLLATLVVARIEGFAVYILIDCLSPTIGLVFSYIIIRVRRGISYGESPVDATAGSLRFQPNSRAFESGQGISMPSVEIQIRLNTERTTHGEGMEMEGPSANDEREEAKYAEP